MKVEKADRRSVRTRRLLEDALVSLLEERRYADISVQDILDRANVGRSTFYAHYYDKEDLLSSTMDRVVDVLGQHLGGGRGGQATGIPSLGLFVHIQEQRRLYQALVRGRGSETLVRMMQPLLSRRVEQQVRAHARGPVADLTVALIAEAVAGTFLTLLRWWMESEVALSAAQMDAYFQRLVLPGIQAVLADEAGR